MNSSNIGSLNNSVNTTVLLEIVTSTLTVNHTKCSHCVVINVVGIAISLQYRMATAFLFYMYYLELETADFFPQSFLFRTFMSWSVACKGKEFRTVDVVLAQMSFLFGAFLCNLFSSINRLLNIFRTTSTNIELRTKKVKTWKRYNFVSLLSKLSQQDTTFPLKKSPMSPPTVKQT